MVLRTARRARTLPALVVPDEQSWVMWGHDLAAAGFTAAASPEEAAAVLLPAEIPSGLVDGAVEALRRVPGTPRALTLASPLGGRPAQDVLATAQRPAPPARGAEDHEGEAQPMHCHAPSAGDGHADEDHGHHHGHGEHTEDHGAEPWAGNMMPIDGTPSRDGLVMDDVEVVLGPLGPPLPGGLVAEIALDGELVSRCRLTPRMEVPREQVGPATSPDPLAPAAWRVAFAHAVAAADGRTLSEADRRDGVSAVEVERAVSHAASARELGRALGWQELADVAALAVRSCMLARRRLADAATRGGALTDAERAAERLLALLDGSRRLRSRTRGRGGLEARQLAGIAGPPARAAGVPVDARLGDPLYEALGFRLTTLSDGDAEARTLLRVGEACAALRLAAAAVRERGSDADAGAPVSGAVEGPRGPLRARRSDGQWDARAPGAERLLRAVGAACTGETYPRAIVALVSFDLSPWRVAG